MTIATQSYIEHLCSVINMKYLTVIPHLDFLYGVKVSQFDNDILVIGIPFQSPFK